MADAVPYTWEEMRARFEPLMSPEACEICSQIPNSSRNDFPDAWKRLERAGLPEQPGSYLRYRCPICHQLYTWAFEIPWNSADPYNPDLAGEPYTRLERMPVRLQFWELIDYRIADERFARAFAAIAPELTSLEIEERRHVGPGSGYWFAHHQLVRIGCGEQKRWVALSDDGEVIRCTLAEVAKIAAKDPPDDFNPSRRAVYATSIDEVTSEYDRCVLVERFDDIRWKADLSDADRACIEELRRTQRIERERIEQLADRTIVHRWVIADAKLIYRVLTAWPNGEVQREDAVCAEAMPIMVGWYR